MQGNILSGFPIILPFDLTSVSAFHVLGSIRSGFPTILPSHVILTSNDVIAVSA